MLINLYVYFGHVTGYCPPTFAGMWINQIHTCTLRGPHDAANVLTWMQLQRIKQRGGNLLLPTACIADLCFIVSTVWNADWVQHASLQASVDFSCCFVIQILHVPVSEGTTKGVCSLSWYTYFELWPDLWIQTPKQPVSWHLRKTDLNHFISSHFLLLCFLLSSSPSLDCTLSWLKERRRKLVIQI